ncbi:MAG: hypothetical protein Sapg2KO_06410 [Saprospiraceae bacterium]
MGVIETEEIVEVLTVDKLRPIISEAPLEKTSTPFSFASLLKWSYLVLTCILLIRFLLQLLLLSFKQQKAEKIDHQGISLSLIDAPIGPFTFLNTIFINKSDYQSNRIGQELLIHELAHRKQWHSLDVILMELIQVFFWFNPFIYAFKKWIKANHEYLADEFVVNSGVAIHTYSEKLLHHTFPDKIPGFVSGFNHLLIKNRLIMLSKNHQKRPTAFRYFSLIPIIFTLVLTTAFDGTTFSDLRSPSEIQNDKSLEQPGTLYASSIIWSSENKKLYLHGKNIRVRHGDNDFSVNGRASYLGSVHYLVFNGTLVQPDQRINTEGMKCNVVKLSSANAKKKYGNKGKMGVVEITVAE